MNALESQLGGREQHRCPPHPDRLKTRQAGKCTLVATRTPPSSNPSRAGVRACGVPPAAS